MEKVINAIADSNPALPATVSAKKDFIEHTSKGVLDKDATYKLWCSLVTPKFEAVLKQFY